MSKKLFLMIAISLLGAVILLNGCEKNGCPEGMHEETIDGQTICVPDDLRR
jgi:hypothetical protein